MGGLLAFGGIKPIDPTEPADPTIGSALDPYTPAPLAAQQFSASSPQAESDTQVSFCFNAPLESPNGEHGADDP